MLIDTYGSDILEPLPGLSKLQGNWFMLSCHLTCLKPTCLMMFERPHIIGCHKNVPLSHKNVLFVQKRASYLDVAQQDKQLLRTIL